MESQGIPTPLSEQASHDLNQILSRLIDSKAGYRQASEEVDDAELKALFTFSAYQREDFIIELEECMEQCGVRPCEKGTVGHIFRATGASLKAMFTSVSSSEIVDECLTFETNAVEDYDALLAEFTVPHTLAHVLRQQRDRIMAEIEQLRRLKTARDAVEGGVKH